MLQNAYPGLLDPQTFTPENCPKKVQPFSFILHLLLHVIMIVQHRSQRAVDKAFRKACSLRQLTTVSELLTHPSLNLETRNRRVAHTAFEKHDVALIDLLLRDGRMHLCPIKILELCRTTSSHVILRAILETGSFLEEGLRESLLLHYAYISDLDAIELLMEEARVDLNYWQGYALLQAFRNMNLPIATTLLSNADLKLTPLLYSQCLYAIMNDGSELRRDLIRLLESCEIDTD